MSEKITPAQKQYQEIKARYKDSMLFFRMGDFYEMFGEDALIASKILGLTITSRDRVSSNPIPMAGVPHHSVNKYIAQLSKQGYKVAICEQLSDASLPGIVERDVVRVITPGTVVEDEMLDQKINNYLVCIAEQNNIFGFAYIDTSTGLFHATQLTSFDQVKNELGKLTPTEIIFPKNQFSAVDCTDYIKKTYHSSQSFYEMFDNPYRVLCEHFHVKTLKGFGMEEMQMAIVAAGTLYMYVQDNEKTTLSHITKITPYQIDSFMQLDETTIRNLELFRNNYNGKKEGSLLAVLDQTTTVMGARLLYQWMIRPLISSEKILYRQEGVDYYYQREEKRKHIIQILKEISDIERIIGKMILGKALPRDILSLLHTIRQSQSIYEQLTVSDMPRVLSEQREKIASSAIEQVRLLIERSIDEQASTLDSAIIAKGYSEEIDMLRSIVYEGKDWIIQYQEQEQKRTGITTLKVSYNKIFGYYIEVSKGQSSKVPEDFIRKQTLVNAERYITPTLQSYADKVMGAEEKLVHLERKIFQVIQEQILQSVKELQLLAESLAIIDVIISFARTAYDLRYVKPEITEGKGVMMIKEGRHPVIESMIEDSFIANEIELHNTKRVMLLTGPNMAGKSTYLRQNALIVLMAQIGSFVPADVCVMDVVDRIFTRIGSGDVLVKGQSTFLVEMQEAANILNNATAKSFIILDEIGRGTSTYDGLSLAWSILEYLHAHTKAKVLFATHYHELIAVVEDLSEAVNYSVAVTERTEGVVFLRKVIPGGTDRSYGIEVAKISGMPSEVIERAQMILDGLEVQRHHKQNKSQMSFLEPLVIETIKVVEKQSELAKKLEQIDINNVTPLQALQMLHELKNVVVTKNKK